ncbi:hypothetical protein D3C81_2274270 [compost metagenome]
MAIPLPPAKTFAQRLQDRGQGDLAYLLDPFPHLVDRLDHPGHRQQSLNIGIQSLRSSALLLPLFIWS